MCTSWYLCYYKFHQAKIDVSGSRCAFIQSITRETSEIWPEKFHTDDVALIGRCSVTDFHSTTCMSLQWNFIWKFFQNEGGWYFCLIPVIFKFLYTVSLICFSLHRHFNSKLVQWFIDGVFITAYFKQVTWCTCSYNGIPITI